MIIVIFNYKLVAHISASYYSNFLLLQLKAIYLTMSSNEVE